MRDNSKATHAISADLSGPQPEVVGSQYTCMLVVVFNPHPTSPNSASVRKPGKASMMFCIFDSIFSDRLRRNEVCNRFSFGFLSA